MRPSSFTQETADKIAALHAGGMLICHIEELEGMPCAETIERWKKARPDFRQQMEDARTAHAHAKEEEAEVIADTDPDTQRAKNRIDVRKWRAAVIAPKVYGAKVNLDITQTVDFRAAHLAGQERTRLMRDQVSTLLPQVIDGEQVYALQPTDSQSVDAPQQQVDPFS